MLGDELVERTGVLERPSRKSESSFDTPSATPSPSPPPLQPPPVPAAPRVKNRVSISMGVVLASLEADADLGLVGTTKIKVGGLVARALIPHETVKPNLRTSLLFLETALQQVDLEFLGKLRGTLRLNSLSVVGERSENALLRNDFQVVLAPVMSDLFYKSSQILFVDTGNVALHICDTPDGAVNVSLSSEKLHAQLSSETITSASSIVRRLLENVDKCKQDANMLISQANIRMTYDTAQQEGGGLQPARRIGGGIGGSLLRKEKLKRKSSSQSFIRRVVERVTEQTKVNLKLEVTGQDLSVALFADVIKDAQWIQLTLSSYELELAVATDKSMDGPPEMVRELITKVGTAVIARMVENPSNTAKNWVRPSTSDPILEFPASSLVMRTRQPISGPRRKELDCWFVTQFGDTIRVTLRVELFAFLRELAMTLKGRLATVLDAGTTAGSSSSGGIGAAVKGDAGKQSEGKALAKAPPAPVVSKGRSTTMQIRAFVLEPRVNVLENLTPYALGKVFELLKIGDPQMMIPEAVHGAITENAEKLLFAVKQICLRIDEAYAPKQKKAAPAAAPSKARPSAAGTTPGVPRLATGLAGAAKAKDAAAKDDSPRSAVTKSRSFLGSSVRLAQVMPRLTPALSRIDARPQQADKPVDEPNESVFSLLDDDF